MTQPPWGPGASGQQHGPQQGPGPQNGHGYPPFHQVGPPYPPQGPRRPRRPYALALGGGSLLLVLALVLVYVFTSGTGSTPGDEQGELAVPGPTTTPSATSETTPSTTTPSPTTTTPSGGAATTTAQPSEAQKVFKLADHPILQNPDAGLANRACQLPGWQNTPQAAEQFFTAARECLDAAWEPFLRSYNLPFTPPKLHFPSAASFDTECGTINVGIATAAYYCEGNLYLPFDGLQTEQYGDAPGVYLALFAHEYGHHVQELSGIMDAAWEKIYAAGQDSSTGQELSRRKELQAQCLSGMFLGAHVDQGGSVTRPMYDAAWYDQETRGDDTSGTRDHGSNSNYAAWWRAGAYDNRIVDCNTFAAPSSEVS